MKCQVFPESRKQSCIITCFKNWLGTNLLAVATVMKKKIYNIDVMIILKTDSHLKIVNENRVVQHGTTMQVTRLNPIKNLYIPKR